MLYEKSRYIAPYDWLINKNIQEWDLRKANISILRSLNLISEDEYQKYYLMPRNQREYIIGCLRRDNKEIENGYQYGILESRKLFFEKNSIKDENVLYIDNDSITTVYDWNETNNIDGKINSLLEFRLKNTYTSFYRLFMIDFLYYNLGNEEKVRFKNIDESRLKILHKDYFIDFLLSTAYTAQNSNILDSIDLIKNVYDDYCNHRLDLGYYREFNHMNKYKLCSTDYYVYYADNVMEKDRPYIDISHNANIIRLFYKFFMNEYFKNK